MRRLKSCPRLYTHSVSREEENQSPLSIYSLLQSVLQDYKMNCKTKAKFAAFLVAILILCLAFYAIYAHFSSGNISTVQEQATEVRGNQNQTSQYTGSLVIGGSILGSVLVAIVALLGYLQIKSNNDTLLAERRLDTAYSPSAPVQQPHPYNNQPMPQIQHAPATQFHPQPQFQPHSSSPSHTVTTTQPTSQLKNEVHRLMRECLTEQGSNNGVAIAPSSLRDAPL